MGSPQQGASLHLRFERGIRRWSLSDGTSVADDVAKTVVANPCIAGVGDALFENFPAQTYRYTGED
jgi:hypothetical protein